jgi:hypothetical protein
MDWRVALVHRWLPDSRSISIASIVNMTLIVVTVVIVIFTIIISLVGIATSYGLDGRGSIPGRGKRFFSSPQRSDRLWGSPSLLPSGYQGALYPGVNRLGREDFLQNLQECLRPSST